MSAALILGYLVLVLLAFSLVLVVWAILRLIVGGYCALAVFIATTWGVAWVLFQLIP